jgi:hypothetical protein
MYELHRTTKIVSSILYREIMDKAKEEANKSMFLGGRKNWNEEDHDIFSKTFFQLMRTHAGYVIK